LSLLLLIPRLVALALSRLIAALALTWVL